MICGSLQAMNTTFRHQPNSFPQPRFARKNLNSWEFNVAHQVAKNSFNNDGNVVGLLDFNGPTNLLKKFVNTTLPYNDSQTFGKAVLSGEMSTLQYNFAVTQNFGSHFFAAAQTTYSIDSLKNLLIAPLRNNCQFLTQTEIDANPALKTYLQDLTQLLTPDNCNTGIIQNSVGPSIFTLGYTTSLQHFDYVDFVDITAQTGFCAPVIQLNATCPKLSALPLNHNVNLGIPVMLNLAVGLYDWLNFGATGLAIAYIKNDQIIPLNTTTTNNNVLFDQSALVQVQHHPFLYFNAYVEAEQILPRLTFLFGMSYAKQFATCYNSCNPATFPNSIINAYPTHKPWETFNFVFSGEIDLSMQDSIIMPNIKCMYILPVWGVSVFKTSELMGQLVIECAYNF
jgi:hypothetical protein